MVSTKRSIVSLSYTASADTPFVITDHDIPFYDANFHVSTQNALYGDMVSQEAPASVGDVISFRNGNIKDIFFKNAGAGANTKIICVATVPTNYVSDALGGLIE